MKQKYSTLTSSASQMYRSAAFLCVLKVRHVFWHSVTPQCVLGCNLMRKRDRSLRFLWERSSHCRCRWKAGRCFPSHRRMLKCYLKPVAAWSCNCCFFLYVEASKGGRGVKKANLIRAGRDNPLWVCSPTAPQSQVSSQVCDVTPPFVNASLPPRSFCAFASGRSAVRPHQCPSSPKTVRRCQEGNLWPCMVRRCIVSHSRFVRFVRLWLLVVSVDLSDGSSCLYLSFHVISQKTLYMKLLVQNPRKMEIWGGFVLFFSKVKPLKCEIWLPNGPNYGSFSPLTPVKL